MSWVRIDEHAPFHPKIVQAGVAAFGLFCAALCYSNRFLTDGFIPVGTISAIFPGTRWSHLMKLAIRLVEVGLWEKKEDGWVIHDYHHYQPSKAEVLEERATQHAAKVRGGQKRASIATRVAGRFATERHQRHQQKYQQPAGDVLVDGNQQNTSPDPTRSDTEEKKQLLLSSARTLTPEHLIELFNELTPDETPSVVTVSPERHRKATRYVKIFPQESFWREAFSQVHLSPFLRGLTPRTNGHESFVADFDWMLSKGKDGTENIVKIHDGKYSR